MLKKFIKRRLNYLREREAKAEQQLKQTLSQSLVCLILFGLGISSAPQDKVEAYILPSELTTEIKLTEIPSQNMGIPVLSKPAPARIFKSPYSAHKKSAFDKAIQISLKNEGVYTKRDSNGYPAKYGINQQYYKPLKGFPEHVKHLTKEQAVKYYRVKYYQPEWDKKGYSEAYRAFLLDSAIQHGCTVNKIEKASNGDLHKAINYRLSHARRWAYRSGNQRLLAGIEKRIKSYEKGIV